MLSIEKSMPLLAPVFYMWLQDFSLSCIGEGNGNPLQCFCLENPRNGGAWWAAVYGVTQSRTRLKWLGSKVCTLKTFTIFSIPGALLWVIFHLMCHVFGDLFKMKTHILPLQEILLYCFLEYFFHSFLWSLRNLSLLDIDISSLNCCIYFFLKCFQCFCLFKVLRVFNYFIFLFLKFW